MTVAGHHLAGLERLPDELLELLFGVLVADLLTKFLQPDKYLQEIMGDGNTEEGKDLLPDWPAREVVLPIRSCRRSTKGKGRSTPIRPSGLYGRIRYLPRGH